MLNNAGNLNIQSLLNETEYVNSDNEHINVSIFSKKFNV